MLQFTKTMAAICAGSLCVFTCHQLPVLGSALTQRAIPLAQAVAQTLSPAQEPEEPVYPSQSVPAPTVFSEELLTEAQPVPIATTTTNVTETPIATPLTATTSTSTIVTTERPTATTAATSTSTAAETTRQISTTEVPEEPKLELDPTDAPITEEAQTVLTAQETWFKAYMDYRTITDAGSVQYALQQDAWTDERGLRRMGDDYLVAMGTGWLTEGCGDRFQVTLETGSQFTVTVGDVKADCHTDAAHLYRPCSAGANVLEFIVDTDLLSTEARTAGTVSVYPELEGNVVEIQKLEK